MASRTLPGLGLNGFWTLGEDGWNTDHDENLRTVSALVNLKVLERVASVPGSPSNGDIYIVTTGLDANKVAVRDNGAWVYLTPFAGWRAWDVDFDGYIHFDGTDWVEETVAAPESGALKYLGTQTAAASASLNFASLITSAYDVYIFDVVDLRPASDDTEFYLRTSANNGSSYDSGTNNYQSRITKGDIIASPGAETTTGTVNTNRITLASGIGNGAAEGISGRLILTGPLGTTRRKRIKFEGHYQDTSGGDMCVETCGVRAATTIIDAVWFAFTSGNITSGKIHMYGVKNS